MKINNIINLFRAYLIENWKRDLRVFLIVAGFAMVSACLGGTSHNALLLVAVSLYPAMFFERLQQSPTSRIHYLMTPAGIGEKFLFSFVMVNVVSILCFFLAILVGDVAGHLLQHSLNVGNAYFFNFSRLIPSTEFWYVLFTFLPIFFFGAIYFSRRGSLIKSLFATLALVIIVSLFIILIVKVNAMIAFPEVSGKFYLMNWDAFFTGLDELFGDFSYKWAKVIFYTGYALFVIWCYVLSFLRLRETEA